MNFTLRVWGQRDASSPGRFETYDVTDVEPDQSFLEMIDGLNDGLIIDDQRPIAFDNDCREGICGACSTTINGRPRGPGQGTTTCQIYMRQFEDGASITVEPFRAATFPVIRRMIPQ